MLYHKGEHKGLRYAFNALELVHQKYPDIVVEMFGAPERPNVPKWYRYHQNLNQNKVNELYNKCSIFLCASVEEGFGLTGAESLATGCALVSTNRLYRNDSVDSLTETILKAINDLYIDNGIPNAAQTFAIKNFSEQLNTENIIKLYKQII